ncbi:MAG TPA: S41 family peptidase, partial [Isosphaeraceae bacterium]
MPRQYFGRPRGLVALLGVAVGLIALFGAQAPALDPTQADRFTAQIVVSLLEHGHLSKPRVNDEIAQKWARLFIKSLDPQKLYFEKPDVEAFLAQDLTLDDQIRRGNIDFAVAVFNKYLQRHDQRLATVLDLLGQKFDFTADESIVDDPDLQDYPADAKEAKERWRKQIKYELLTKRILKSDEAEAIDQLKVRYRDLNRYFHQFDTTDLLERYLTAMTMAVDPHSSYMGSKSFEDLMGQQLHLSLEGIGASLSVEDGFPIVKEIVPGGAADKDGRLAPEDKIVGIEADEGKVVDFVEKKLADVVRMIRGPRGTKVRLIVQPADSKDRKVYELTREKIELKDAHAKGQVIETKGADGKPRKIGVIDLPSFYGDTAAVRRGDPDAVSATQDCAMILEGFKKQGVDGVLIDLRRNGGGLLVEAITLSGLFIDSGPVVQVRDPESLTHHDDDEPGTAWDGPLTVLISHYSASASEIFAGVIKDYGRGL